MRPICGADLARLVLNHLLTLRLVLSRLGLSQCDTYTDSDLNSTWPWRSNQDDVNTSVATIDNLMDDLNANWTSISGDATLASYTTTNVTNMGCAFSGDSGVLGYTGLLKCTTLNRFVHKMVAGYCEDVYAPLNTLAACLLVIAIVILLSNWVEVALRRESENYNQVAPTPTKGNHMEMKNMA
jgi:hypothetical protein